MRDLKNYKTRTILVVLSTAVGIFTLGTIISTRTILVREMTQSYAAINPAHATLFTAPFDKNLVQTVRHMPKIHAAEGRGSITVRFDVKSSNPQTPRERRQLELMALPNFEDIRIYKIWPNRGNWPPAERELLLERGSLDYVNANVGDTLTVILPNGKQRQLPVTGVVYDPDNPSPIIAGQAAGYITLDTLEWLGQPPYFDRLYITVAGDTNDKTHIQKVAKQVRNKFERTNRTVNWIWIPDPGRHPAEQILDPLLLMLGVLGLLSLLLSGFLMINTISALLTQQIRQIGVMKAIGAYHSQIMGMYLVTAFIFGLLALVIALPLSILGARLMVGFIAGLINVEVTSVQVTTQVIALQIGVGLLVPLLTALPPVFAGTKITVREAIASYSLGQGKFGRGTTDRLLQKIHGLPRPVLLSLRNTFRRKGRLILTLLTLSLASAIFMAVSSVHTSLLNTLEDALDYWKYDIQVQFSRPHRIARIERQARQVPGVVHAESWGFTSAHRVRPDSSKGDTLFVIAPPPDSTMIRPTLIKGRWLLPQDESAVVINSELLKEEPDLNVGEEINLNIEGRETAWQIVGVVRGILSGPFAYANYPYFSRIVRDVDQAGSVQVVTQRHNPIFQAQVAEMLEREFQRAGMQVSSIRTTVSMRQQVVFQFNILVIFLLIMAVLLAIVGGLGLTGTMSINVLERTREIGVMRATGATNGLIWQIVISEGLLISLLSWLIGAVLAFPASLLLSNAVGMAFLEAPLSFSFSLGGMLFWLVIMIILATLASFLPAWRASRLSVREVLTYE